MSKLIFLICPVAVAVFDVTLANMTCSHVKTFFTEDHCLDRY